MTRTRHVVAFALPALATGASVYAQTPVYPVKPIRIIVPTTAGSTQDILSRLIGTKLSEILKQPIVTENRAGASGPPGFVVVHAAEVLPGDVLAPARKNF